MVESAESYWILPDDGGIGVESHWNQQNRLGLSLKLAESLQSPVRVGRIGAALDRSWRNPSGVRSRKANSCSILLEIPMAARDSSGSHARCFKRAVMHEPSKDVQRLCVSRRLWSPSSEIAVLPRSPAFSSAFFPPVQGGAEALWRRSFKIAII